MRLSLPVVAAVSSLTGALAGAVLALLLGIVVPGGRPDAEPRPAVSPELR